MTVKNVFFAFLLLVFSCPALAMPEVTPELTAAMEDTEKAEFISVNIRLTEQYGAHELYAASRQIVDSEERRALL